MKKFILAAAIAASGCAVSPSPATAHPQNDIKPAGRCNAITQSQWRQIRPGMTVQQVEHVTGCHGSHSATNQFKTFVTDVYFFKTGSRALAEVHFKNGKMWQKLGYYSGL